ncbi:hypothetical protein LUZ60_012438 [Juncus effusus]|nr:hypothetical protein LUZ60_012438 [Juncus effusus]
MPAKGRSPCRPALLLLLLIFFLIFIHADANYADVVTRQFTGLNPRSGSRFLASKANKGGSCNAGANDCAGQLTCCRKICVDVSSDSSNCGACGRQCPFGQICCGSVCTAVAYDNGNCGECGMTCNSGSNCVYGVCGYAA